MIFGKGKNTIRHSLDQFDETSRQKAQQNMNDDEEFIVGFIHKDDLIWRMSSRVFLTDQKIIRFKPDWFKSMYQTKTYPLDNIETVETKANGGKITIEGQTFKETFVTPIEYDEPRFDTELRKRV